MLPGKGIGGELSKKRALAMAWTLHAARPVAATERVRGRFAAGEPARAESVPSSIASITSSRVPASPSLVLSAPSCYGVGMLGISDAREGAADT